MNAPLRDRYPLAFTLYPYQRSADQDAAEPAHHPVIIAGGGAIGLTLALDLGLKGQPVVVLDDHEGVGTGSRAICFAKRTLEICHRLGAGEPLVNKGVVWSKGRVFRDEDELFNFDLLPEDGHRYPAFINLSQIHFEKFMHEAIERANANGAQIDIRGKNRVDALTQTPDGTTIEVMTPDGPYTLTADYVVACDGARSPLRDMLGLGFEGRVFEDNFLIADVKMTADFPTERWFWFEPWFKSGDSALLHKQPDDIWRIDFQLGWDIDRDKELKPENIRARVDQMLGEGVEYELDWCSIYTFQCRRMHEFVHDRVIFCGDSAHQVSPFGARGANSGVQDAENLAWRLDMLLRGQTGPDILTGYNRERVMAADENILNSSRATDFLTPKSDISRVFRNAVLDLAGRYPFARTMVNSGRLSVPCIYDDQPGFGPDALPGGPTRTRPGAPCPDAPLGNGFLLDDLGGGFQVIGINSEVPEAMDVNGIAVTGHVITATDAITERYLGDAAQAVYLLRPDQHIVARWDSFDASAVAHAVSNVMDA